MKYSIYFTYTIISIVILLSIIYIMFYLDYDFKPMFEYLNSLNVTVANSDLTNLINNNSIGNLPAINITTNNTDVERLQTCSQGPIYMGERVDDFACKKLCGSSGTALLVNPGDEIFSNGQKLDTGAWCTVVRPKCNLNTTYVVATANSVACRSKFPRIFGGPTGDRIIACNNSSTFNVNNILWDYQKNTRVTPQTLLIDEDEKLPDGSYRFRCKFSDDVFENQFIAHPVDRFHPIRNYCSKQIYRASREIRLTENFDCDCGNFRDTRVKNKIANDPSTPCSNCFYEQTGSVRTVPYDCIKPSSLYYDAYSSVPCMPSKVVTRGTYCDTIKLDVEEDSGNFPFHNIQPIRLAQRKKCDTITR